MRFPLDTLHTPIVLSLDPDTKYSPFFENTKVFTPKERPIKVLIRSPLDTFQRTIVLS